MIVIFMMSLMFKVNVKSHFQLWELNWLELIVWLKELTDFKY